MQTHTVVLIMLATAISGCADTPLPPEAEPVQDVVAEEAVAPAPTANEWAVGKWWGYHAYFGIDDSVGQHFNAIVIEDLGDAWRLGTDDAEMAAIDAMFGIPILGTFSKAKLASQDAHETPFTWYDFPLADGKTWKFMDDPEWGPLTAVAEPTTIMLNNIERPGYRINVTTADGSPYALYDHTEAVGWFTNLTIFSPDGRVDINARSMGFGDRWDGIVYGTTAERVLATEQVIVVPEAVVEPAPYHEFEVDDEATHVWAVVYAVAAAGGSVGTLIDPNGDRYDVVAAGEFDVDVTILDRVPAVAGTWRVVLAGAGAASITGVEAYALQEQQFEF